MNKRFFLRLLAATAAALAVPLVSLAAVTVQFSNAGNATTTPGSQVIINGTITSDASTYLNSPANLSVTGNGQTTYGNPAFPSINASTSATYLPMTVSSSTPYSGPLVAVDVPASASVGNYYGFYGIIGGSASTDSNVLTSQPFYLHIVSTGTATTSPTDSSSTPAGLQIPLGMQIPAGAQDQNTSSFTVYANGPRLIKLDGDGTVYWVSENNLKIAMTSAKVFLSYNNKWSDVQTVGQDEFNFYQNAKFIWLNGTGAIYLINNGVKQLIPSSIWNSSGIDASQIINVNKTDFASYKTGVKITSADELNLTAPILPQLTVTLDPGMDSLTAKAGDSVAVSGTIQNDSSNVIYLNGIGANFSYSELVMDNSDFLNSAPKSLKPGESYQGTLFHVFASNVALSGNYSFSFAIQGGYGASDYGRLTSQNLSITIK